MLRYLPAVLVFGSLAAVSCDDGAGATDEPSAVLAVLPTGEVRVAVAATRSLRSVRITRTGGAQEPVTGAGWASPDPSVATVDSGGVVLGVGPGQATVTAHDPATDATGSAPIRCVARAWDRLVIEPDTLSIDVGLTVPLRTVGVRFRIVDGEGGPAACCEPCPHGGP